MIIELKHTKDRFGVVTLTQFSGSVKEGLCLQLTGQQDYISLTKGQALELAQSLELWAHDLLPEELPYEETP